MAPVLWTLRLVVVWMTAVMLMQPAVDHHLLERVPGHEHWPPAVGADADHHLHYADIAHHHDHGAPLLSDAEPAGQRIWPAASGQGERAAVTVMAGMPLTDLFPAVPANSASAAHPTADSPAGLTFAPPLPPPVALA